MAFDILYQSIQNHFDILPGSTVITERALTMRLVDKAGVARTGVWLGCRLILILIPIILSITSVLYI